MEANINLYDELPSFANAENKKKHAEILKMSKALESVTSECTELQDRLHVIQDHLKSVQVEITTTQQILTAREEEVKTEKHLQQLALREKGKIESDLAKIEEQTTDILAKNSVIEAKTFKSQQRIEAFKEEARINQAELEQWVQAARDKEEDYLVIQRYQRDDESRIRSMLLEIEKATALVDSKRNELEQEVTQTRSLQIELDQTADQFRKLHHERAQLLAQWEATLQKMQMLNEQISKTTENFDQRKGEVAKYRTFVNEGKKNLEMAQRENTQFERMLTINDGKVTQKHKQYEMENKSLMEFEETVETQRHRLDKLESDARAHRQEIDELRRKTEAEIAKKQSYLERLQETNNALLTQKDSTNELNEQTNLMNNFLKNEEAQLQQLEKAIDAEKNSIFKLSQEVYKARKHEKSLLAEIQGSQGRARNLQIKIQEFDKETQKQMELLYNSNFAIQQMERKISRIQGDQTEEEQMELQLQIDQLSEILKGKESTEKMLSQQLSRLELDLRQTTRRKASLEEQQKDLDIRLTELNLDQDSLDKSTVKARTEKQEVLVRINMLRLQIEKLSSQVEQKCDELISLENRRQQLQLSMQERLEEIDAHLAALKVQLKTEEEARHAVMIELQERKKREETLSAKYSVITGKYNVDGEEVNQTYHIIKFAQEREEIARKGDELENEVKTAIKELRALERAMGKLNGQNQSLRNNFSAVSDDDQDLERKKSLEEQRRVAQQRLNARRAEARAIAEERTVMEATYEQRSAKIDSMRSDMAKMQPILEKLKLDNRELVDKLKRAATACNRSKETHRRSSGVNQDAPYPSSLFEMDVELKMQQMMLDSAVQELCQIADINTEIQAKLTLGLEQIGMKPKPSPTRSPVKAYPVSPPSSRSGSSARSHTTARSNASNASKISVTKVSIGGDMLGEGAPRSIHSSSSNRSTASTASRSGVSVQRVRTVQGARQTTPRKKAPILQPQITRI